MRKSCPEAKLDELSTHIRNGLSVKQSKDKNGLPITRIETIWSETIDSSRVGYAGIQDGEKDGWLLNDGDILISHINSKTHLGKCALYTGTPKKIIHGMNLLCLRPDMRKVFPGYLVRVLQSAKFKSKIPSITKDSVNQSSFNISSFKGLTIPLPPLAEQKRIAAILDKADAIRRKRQATIKLADDFLRATFLDMFGDPVTNPKGWETIPLKELGDVKTGNTPSRKRTEFYGNDIEWIKSDNINTPDHFLTKSEEGLTKEGEEVGRKVAPYSTLVTCIAGSFDCIGNAALSDRKVAFNQQINAITPKKDTDPFFLYCLILNAKKLIQNASTNSMKGMVSKGKFQEILLIKPALPLQQKFGSFFQSHIKKVNNIQMSERLSYDLFSSLTQRAFRGELFHTDSALLVQKVHNLSLYNEKDRSD